MEHPYLQYDPDLHAFGIFSPEHLITLAVIFCVCILLYVGRKRFEEPGKRNFFRFFGAGFLFVSYMVQQFWFFSQNAWSLKSSLPLQLSDLVVILAIIMLLTKSFKLFQFMYFAGIGSSVQAILTPDLGAYSFPHFQYLEFFIFHGGTLIACLFMLWIYRFEPYQKSLWITSLIINVYGAMIFFFDKKLHANYLYLMKKTENHSLLDFLGDWPWYIFTMDAAMLLIFYILYSPIWIKKQTGET